LKININDLRNKHNNMHELVVWSITQLLHVLHPFIIFITLILKYLLKISLIKTILKKNQVEKKFNKEKSVQHYLVKTLPRNSKRINSWLKEKNA